MAFDKDYLAALEYVGGKQGSTLWVYTTTDSAATIAGAGYFVDAGSGTQSTTRGLNLNDIVIVTQVTTLPNTGPAGVSVYVVSAVDADGDATVIKTATA